MSYCRWSTPVNDTTSYVYLYLHDFRGESPVFECCACELLANGDQADYVTNGWQIVGLTPTIAHIERHIELGHPVPDDVLPALRMFDSSDETTWR